jgi:hypothetical protein
MATKALILERTSPQRTADARAATVPAVSRHKLAAPASPSVWPPATPDILSYRTEAHRLRSQAIAEALTRVGRWLRR